MNGDAGVDAQLINRDSGTLPLARVVGPAVGRASAVYDALSTNNCLAEQSCYTNLGYWRDAPATLDDACEALAELLGQAAGLGHPDLVLDVGFGFGDQDMFWMERFGPRQIVGLNITPIQVYAARARVARRGLASRIDLRVGSATAMPFDAGSFDKVTALESALHFDTRASFFGEAYRVLRPGGRIATADVIPMPELKQTLAGRFADFVQRAFWHVSRKNMYPRLVYARKLAEAGFTNVRVVSIREYVYQPFYRYLARRLAQPALAARLSLFYLALWHAALQHPEALEWYDYVIAVADKPVL